MADRKIGTEEFKRKVIPAKPIPKTVEFGTPYYAYDHDLQALLYCEIDTKTEKYSAADICFICDITGSMDSHINTIKEILIDFVNNVEELIETKPRISFIGFRDKMDTEQISFHDFTTNSKEMTNFIEKIVCDGGGDTCEDLETPLMKSLTLDWRSDLIYVYLLLDAPAHGSSYHDKNASDDYPGDDANKIIEKLAFHFMKSRINLVILKCNNLVDKMIDIIKKYYNTRLNKLTVIDMSDKEMMKKDFAKNFLITITKNITDSIISSRYNNFRKVKHKGHISHEIEGDPELDFGKKFLGVVHTGSIDKMNYEHRQYGYEIKLSKSVNFKCTIGAAKVGAGAFSDCFPLEVDDDKNYVAKILRTKEVTVGSLKPDIEGNSFAKLFAEKFNFYLKKMEKLEGIDKPMVLRVLPLVIMQNLNPDIAGIPKAFLAQKFLEGKYVKFNNNYGWRSKEDSKVNMLAQSFSHFTFEYSMGTMMVVDIQGIINETGGMTITDPAIHSLLYKGHFGETNHGKVGILRFFKTHICNDYCKKLKLAESGKLKTDRLSVLRAEHKGEKGLEHLYADFDEKLREWRKKIMQFDPSIEPKIEEELEPSEGSDDGTNAGELVSPM